MPPIRPQAAAAANANVASKACHNCRRRRLKCDRAFPHCTKCTSRQVECLGYGQLFLWTGAVATRGRLAGRTSSAVLYQKSPGAKSQSDQGDRAAASPSRSPEPVQAQQDVRMQVPETPPLGHSESNGPPEATCNTPEGAHESALENTHESTHENTHENKHEKMQLVGATRSVAAHSATSTPWILVDPLFQDMKKTHRQYLDYFSARLCLDLVAHDVPDRNPFRGLLPLTQAHPLLQQVIIAASAAHMCNVARPLAPDSISRGEAPSQWRMDALVAKQKALQMMPEALQSIEQIGGDVVLAAALFLVNIELIESGKRNWRPHLEGAGRIMGLVQPLRSVDQTLRDYIMSDCLIYLILSSAFNPSTPDPHMFFQTRRAISVLEKTANSYFCCPPEVLEILMLTSQLSNTSTTDSASDEMVTAAGAALLQRAQNVNIIEWARHVREIPGLINTSVGSRFRAGSTHRLAACLYILQAVPSLQSWLGDELVDVLIEDFFHNLERIPPPDPNFKSTAWPTFIFGATAKTPERQAWVMNRLKQLTVMCPWGFLYTAIETLQLLWNLEAEGKLTKSWLQTIRDPEMNFLIV